ncbi:S8 family serine peptidase [Arundinibacter roseus]|uniref:T9SS type A sorting domain-containing protein n=1 Tax=Arundinibacter roseus TaxID=2070510 RepID=A0A4R4KNU2_9BACT|nr:S8 family serine peptidase [Arundinibacter roseus]TDB68251.1 T9SS type A sorting domain-containing protein [Arundinibacter roseus]
MRKSIVLIAFGFFFLSPCLLWAQEIPRYLVLFSNKSNSPFSTTSPEAFLSPRAIERRARQGISITTSDLPVNPGYTEAVRQTGAKVLFTSRWLNAALLEATDSQLTAIKALPFFKSIERDLPLATSQTAGIGRLGAVQQKFGTQETIDHGRMLTQLNLLGIPQIHEKGIRGKGILIAVLDAGFSRGNEVQYIRHLFDNKQIIDTYDFISRESDVFDDHFHGLNCLSTIAANQPGTMVGAAFEADFALYRSENEYSETPYEEATWLMAAERADSVGADILSCSLGYNQFDNPIYDYSYADMDGKTALVTRAAQQAARTGMLVVNAAGNSGNDPWKFITAPADADSILTVGATFSNRSYAPFSSVGPTADGRLKPDVAAMGAGTVIGNNLGLGTVSTGSGTSFATPQIAGFAALLWQAYPFLRTQELIQIIRRAGHQAANPDNLLGFGVPTIQIAEETIQTEYTPLGLEPSLVEHIEIYPNPVEDYVSLHFGPVSTMALLQLYTPTGTMVQSHALTTVPTVQIPVSALPAGTYILKITMNKEIKALKFLKH